MTQAYVVPPVVYSLMVMGAYLDLIDQDLPPDGYPLKILYAQRIGFFPSTALVDSRDLLARVDADLNGSVIPLKRFLNGLIKNRLITQAETMVRNMERRYSRWYRINKETPQSSLSTVMDNRSAVYLPTLPMLKSVEKVVSNTLNGDYLRASIDDGSPYAERMAEIQAEFVHLVSTNGERTHGVFSSSRFFPLMTSLLEILRSGRADVDEDYRYRMLPITRIIYVLCRMFNGDISDKKRDDLLLVSSCDASLYVSDSTLAIMAGSTSEVLRTMGIREAAPISRSGQIYLSACDSFVDERDLLDGTSDD